MPRKYMPEHVPANYLKHMNSFLTAMETDERLKPAHISMYLALFGCWNKHFFENPFAIYRPHLMHISHIGSRNTYTQSLKDLHTFGYIRYYPSDFLAGAARVSVLPLRPAEGFPAGVVVPPESPVFPPDENKAKPATAGPKKKTAAVSKTVPGGREKETVPVSKKGRLNKQINSSNKKQSALPTHQAKKKRPQRPSGQDEVTAFFKEMRFADNQAPLFFNHYEANGWRQSNGLPIRNWKAAAEKWVLNIPNFKKQGYDNATRRLHTGQSRYTDPL